MIEELRAALQSPNVAAFLRVIREGETGQADSAYRMMFGGGLFSDFADHPRHHPRQKITRGSLTSTAAGAYQFLSRTWDECRYDLGLPDFSPASQDLAAVFLVRRRGALADVLAGRIEAAIEKCAKEWASLPGSPYGQPVQTLAGALAVYAKWGGALGATPADSALNPGRSTLATPAVQGATPADPRPAEPIAPPTPKGDPMPSFSDVIRRPETAGLLSLVNPLLGLVPSIAKLFMDGDKTVPERNVAVAVAVADAAQKALADAGKPAENMQQVVETIAADPAARDIVRAGIIADCGHLVEAGGGGIEGARKANAETAAGPGFWLTPAFWITLLLMPLVYFTVYTVLSSERFSGEVQSMVIAAVVSGVLGSVTGFFLGSSFSSQRKDAQKAAQ